MTVRTGRSHTNQLIHSTSPYLLQHAHNPVDWFPWGEEALEKAKVEDKPIFLSVGYSACHWCHVMERESFENERVAAVMNEHFINIKVDREERPDLDEIYMSAVQAITGQGGWPMSVFLTADLKPFYGGTYFPPDDRYGRPGFTNLLQSIAQTYKQRRDDIILSADKLTDHIQDMMRLRGGDDAVEYSLIEACYQEMSRRFDSRHGGFGGAPKFPHSMDISLLLRYAHKNGDKQALEMAEVSLEKMARGGMYDQLGGGFHRYSTDAQWLIPHFEKMLYDNALLAKTYTEAFQLTQKPIYRRIVEETLDYVLREMTAPNGSFYSTQDADSEGKEGAFFVWTPEQIASVVDEDASEIVCRYFGVESGGNFEEGTSALHVPNDDETVAKSFDIFVDKLHAIVGDAKTKLFEARESRMKPGRDEKILTDWNGLMVSAMAFAGNVLNQEKYVRAAERACEFIFSELQSEGKLLHTYKDGRAHTDAFLSDYSFTIQGLLDTYEASRNPHWLEEALRLTHIMLDKFWDDGGGAFFFTANDGEALIARSKNPMDNAVPSGNSIAVLCLLRLAEMTGDDAFREKATVALGAFSDALKRIPSGFTQMLSAVDFLLGSPKEIVLAGNDEESMLPMQRALFERFLPNKVVLYRFPHVEEALMKFAPVVEEKTSVDAKVTAYVCQNFTCGKPVDAVDELVELLDA